MNIVIATAYAHYTDQKICQNELLEIALWGYIFTKYSLILLIVIFCSVQLRLCMENVIINVVFMNFK